MKTEFLRPNPDKEINGEPLQVRDIVSGKFLPAEGKNMPLTFYWLRLIREGDVLRGKAPANPSLEEAIDICFEANDAEHLTNGGKPDCKVLTELVGRPVSAAERDAELAKGENE